MAKTAVAKAQIAAKYGGVELQARSDDSLATPFELITSTGAITQPNAAARYTAVASETGLYPTTPFDSSKRQLAGVIDAWIEFGSTEIQSQLQQIKTATSKAVGVHGWGLYVLTQEECPDACLRNVCPLLYRKQRQVQRSLSAA